jgi:hypothetical protein
MNNVVDLQLARLEDNLEFVSDLCRFAENILTEQQVKKKYRFTDDVWMRLGENDSLVEKIEAEKVRRIRDGSSKREKAQLLVVRAPDVVAAIMMDPDANPRHRIDSAKVLDDFAANGPQGAPAADRFQITINLGADTLRFDKSIEVNPNDTDPNDIGPMIAAIAMKKSTDDGNGEPV